MFILAFGSNFQDLINNLPFTYLAAERVTMRFVIIPFLFLVVFACIRLDKFIKTKSFDFEKGIQFAVVSIIGISFLVFHGYTWRLTYIEALRAKNAIYVIDTIITLPDPTYYLILSISAAITFLALILVIRKIRFER